MGSELDVWESRIGDELGMDEEGELCHTVGDSRPWSRVVGVRVDGDRSARERLQPRGLAGRACVVEAARRDDDELVPLVAHRLP